MSCGYYIGKTVIEIIPLLNKIFIKIKRKVLIYNKVRLGFIVVDCTDRCLQASSDYVPVIPVSFYR